MDVAAILNLIDAGEYGLPEFQRGYVWSREQVRRFMSSLYHENPVGSLLVWVPETATDVRGNGQTGAGNVKLIIDGQQRITTLYGITRGKAPLFFRGNPNSFLNLYFDLEGAKGDEFEFYGPVKMRDNPRWVNVTDVLRQGAGNLLQSRLESGQLDITDLGRLNKQLMKLESVLKKVFHIETITGRELDEVVDIFNAVNSGGTKLNAADLAMARQSAKRPAAREELDASLRKWSDAGYRFDFNWLLRGVTITVTGGARFRALNTVDSAAFGQGLRRFEKHNDDLLLQIRANLGLDNSSVLRSEFSLLVLARYLEINDGLQRGEAEISRLLYWYIQTMIWGRYSGSTETRLNQDLAILRNAATWQDQIAGLIEALRNERGTLKLAPQDFQGSWRNNRFYPLLYLLTRVWRARDLHKNIPLSMDLLSNPLELHHIFPKSRLYELGHSRRDVNTLANFAFLTAGSNRSIGNRWPADYLAEAESKFPGVLLSQWIPTDPYYWEPGNYDSLLERRRELLADAANTLLETLASGCLPQDSLSPGMAGALQLARPVHITSDEEERDLLDLQQWMEDNGLPPGETGHELVDEANEDLLATLDLAWPDGVQEGLSQPVALLIDEEDEIHNIAGEHGFRYFTDVARFRRYVQQEVLVN